MTEDNAREALLAQARRMIAEDYYDPVELLADLLERQAAVKEATRMRELLRLFSDEEPLYGSEYDGDTCCQYCAYQDPGHYEKAGNGGRWVHDRTVLERHGADCLWRRACELLGLVPQDPEPMQPAQPSPAPAPVVQPFLTAVWQEHLRRALAISPAEQRRRELWQELPPERPEEDR